MYRVCRGCRILRVYSRGFTACRTHWVHCHCVYDSAFGFRVHAFELERL